MKWVLTVAAGAVCLASSALADAPLVFCVGNGCGGDGPRNYAYDVDAVSYPMMEFFVGTNDLDESNYTNVLTPPGWNFAIDDWGEHHTSGFCTPHVVGILSEELGVSKLDLTKFGGESTILAGRIGALDREGGGQDES